MRFKETKENIDILISHYEEVLIQTEIKTKECTKREEYFKANEAKVTNFMAREFINCLRNIKEGNPVFYEEVEMIIIDNEEDEDGNSNTLIT